MHAKKKAQQLNIIKKLNCFHFYLLHWDLDSYFTSVSCSFQCGKIAQVRATDMKVHWNSRQFGTIETWFDFFLFRTLDLDDLNDLQIFHESSAVIITSCSNNVWKLPKCLQIFPWKSFTRWSALLRLLTFRAFRSIMKQKHKKKCAMMMMMMTPTFVVLVN